MTCNAVHHLAGSGPVHLRLKVAAHAQRQPPRTSSTLSPQPNARSCSARVSDMSRSGARAKGWDTRGGRRTKGNRATRCGLHSCSETSVWK